MASSTRNRGDGSINKEVITQRMSGELYSYVLNHNSEPEVLRELRDATAVRFARAKGMQVSPEQGTFLSWLVSSVNAKKVIELGVFTGYSSISMARALPAGGKLLACDRDGGPVLDTAREFWEKAGLLDKIEEHIAPGAETLEKLLNDGQAGTFDFAFVDADKQGYARYYEQLLKLLRPGGIIAFDNMLWHGQVADPNDMGSNTIAIRSLNDLLAGDDRVTSTLVTIGDGMFLCTKK